ncbi:DUF6356 family protein [Polycladidibacter stylochi]|uniref:DUF6356 family protein n=1 Tax=Polycladidibacter stylochi TaxID=1807766 RepID=UPI00082EDFCD|nr:DUF6356 family protein [Pseudovibrio stylochi]
MRVKILELFRAHPRTVNESYLEHARFASSIGLKLLFAALAAFIHALLPFLFEKTASQIIIQLYDRFSNRGKSK